MVSTDDGVWQEGDVAKSFARPELQNAPSVSIPSSEVKDEKKRKFKHAKGTRVFWYIQQGHLNAFEF